MYMSGLGATRSRRATFHRPIVVQSPLVPAAPVSAPASAAPASIPGGDPNCYGPLTLTANECGESLAPAVCNPVNAPSFSMSPGTNDDLVAFYNSFCGEAMTHGVDYLQGMDTHGNMYDPAGWGALFTRVFAMAPPPASLFPAGSAGKPMPLNTYYSIAGPWWAKQVGLSGLGDSTTDLSGVVTAIQGPNTACDSGYSYSTDLGVCVSNSGICNSGYTYNAVSGVCQQNTGVMAWIQTGNNAVYAGLGAVALVLLLSMMGKR